MAEQDDISIRVRGIRVAFGSHVVLDNLDLDVRRGEILGFVGPSGSGKSVLMRTVVGLTKHSAGTVEVFGKDFDQASEAERRAIEQRWGILFQNGALFSSLTVGQNVEVPFIEHTKLRLPSGRWSG